MSFTHNLTCINLNVGLALTPSYTDQGNSLAGPGCVSLISPDGYKFIVHEEDVPGTNPVTEVALHVQDLNKSLGTISNKMHD